MRVKKQQLELDMEQTGSRSRKEYIMRNTRLDEAQLELRLLGEISITSDMQMTPPLWQKAKEN